MELKPSPVTLRDVSVIVESLIIVVVNVGKDETCTWYIVAEETDRQRNVSEFGRFMTLLGGEMRLGA
jgi:hypothetical protein